MVERSAGIGAAPRSDVSESTTPAASTGKGLRPLPDLRDEIRGLMRRMLLVLAVLGVVTVAVAAGVVGPAGAWAAAWGVGLGALLTAGSTGVLLFVVNREPARVVSVLAGGAAVRMALYGVVLVVLSRFEGLHRPSLAFATAVVIVVTLVLELRTLSRMPRLHWLEIDLHDAATPATRS